MKNLIIAQVCNKVVQIIIIYMLFWKIPFISNLRNFIQYIKVFIQSQWTLANLINTLTLDKKVIFWGQRLCMSKNKRSRHRHRHQQKMQACHFALKALVVLTVRLRGLWRLADTIYMSSSLDIKSEGLWLYIILTGESY